MKRYIRLIPITIAACSLILLVVLYLRYIDWPSHPDPMPTVVGHALGEDGEKVTKFYEYDLGGFIDHEFLWRIEAPSPVVDRLVKSFILHPVGTADEVPGAFWRQPPCWWPRKSDRAKYYKSEHFVADRRGRDGSHYFLMHNEQEGAIYVWYKDNF
jgi:hypothetical protein